MYLLRRTALKALSSPSTSFIAKPRSITTSTSSVLRTRQQWIAAPLQRRFASGEAAPPSAATTTDETVPEPPSKPEQETRAEYGSENLSAPQGQSASREQSTVGSAISSATETVKETASSAAQYAPEATQSARETLGGVAYGAGTAAGLGQSQGSAAQGSSQQGSRPSYTEASPTTLYVGNLFFEVSEDALKREFERFGNVVKARIIYDNRGLSKGFGYIEYSNPAEATAALEAMDQQVFEGRRITVQHHKQRAPNFLAQPRKPNEPSKTLFIGNMSFEMSDKDLNDLFRPIRNVLDVRVAIDRRSGQPRGFAHADFIDVASAQKAMEMLKDKEIYGRRLRVDYSMSGGSRMQQ